MAKIRSKRLNGALAGFFRALETRLAQKEREGFMGWDNPYEISDENLRDRAREKIKPATNLSNFKFELSNRLLIDCVAFIVFLWARRNGWARKDEKP